MESYRECSPFRYYLDHLRLLQRLGSENTSRLLMLLGQELLLGFHSTQLGGPEWLGILLVADGRLVNTLVGELDLFSPFEFHCKFPVDLFLGNTHSNKLTTRRIKFRFEPVHGSLRFAEFGVKHGMFGAKSRNLLGLVFVLLLVHFQLSIELINLFLQIMNMLIYRSIITSFRVLLFAGGAAGEFGRA